MICMDEIDRLIDIAFYEDFAQSGDVTTDAIFPNGLGEGTYILKAKDNGILCGRQIFERVFNKIDSSLKVSFSLLYIFSRPNQYLLTETVIH